MASRIAPQICTASSVLRATIELWSEESHRSTVHSELPILVLFYGRGGRISSPKQKAQPDRSMLVRRKSDGPTHGLRFCNAGRCGSTQRRLRLHHAQRLTQGTIRRWARSPATDKQRELLKLAFLGQMSLYEAKCRIAFKFNQSATQDLVLEHAKHREAA